MNKQIEALKMLDDWLDDYTPDEVRKALQEALAEAEKQEPVAVIETYNDTPTSTTKSFTIRKRVRLLDHVENLPLGNLYTHPAPAEKQEPYAWEINHLGATSPPPYIVKHNPIYKNDSNTRVIPLFTHPATWQSLSDDEICDILISNDWDMMTFARAIEKALKEKNFENN